MSENTHQLGTYYKRNPEGNVVAYPNLPAGGDWPAIYGESGLTLEPPEDEMPEEVDELTDEQLLDATAQGPDASPATPEPEKPQTAAQARTAAAQSPDDD